MGMKEIINAVQDWFAQGHEVAYAVVVATEGSGPRELGAMMAVNDAGEVAGSVSGGCVESAVVDEAIAAISEKTPRLLSYGVADELGLSVGLTCGGTIHIFVDRLEPGLLWESLVNAVQSQSAFALCTVVGGSQMGAKLLVFGDETQALVNSTGDRTLDRLVSEDARTLLGKGLTQLCDYSDSTAEKSESPLSPPFERGETGSPLSPPLKRGETGSTPLTPPFSREVGGYQTEEKSESPLSPPFERGETGSTPLTPPFLRGVGGDQTEPTPLTPPFERGETEPTPLTPPFLRGVGGDQTEPTPLTPPFLRGVGGDQTEEKSGSPLSPPFERGETEPTPLTPPLKRGVGGDRVFIQSFTPPPRLIIIGAIDFSRALCQVGKLLAYHVTICDARSRFATVARFPDADEVEIEWPHHYIRSTAINSRTAIVVLTHDPKFDIPALREAVRTPAGYIGAMGSRRTHGDRVRRLQEIGMSPEEIARISSPIGLDIGGNTPEETAISIFAEIIALRSGCSGGRLTGGSEPIHRR
jgi:xanthine dehydrogenase accessory factor